MLNLHVCLRSYFFTFSGTAARSTGTKWYISFSVRTYTSFFQNLELEQERQKCYLNLTTLYRYVVLPNEWSCHKNNRFQPKSRMNHKQIFQALAKPSVQQLITFFQPWKGRNIATTRAPMQIYQNVVVSDKLVQCFHYIPVIKSALCCMYSRNIE